MTTRQTDKKKSVRTLRNHEKRLKKIEEKNTGTITEKNIWKTITDITAKFDTVEVWAQGAGASARYDVSRYDTGYVYDPVNPTAWVKVREVST